MKHETSIILSRYVKYNNCFGAFFEKSVGSIVSVHFQVPYPQSTDLSLSACPCHGTGLCSPIIRFNITWVTSSTSFKKKPQSLQLLPLHLKSRISLFYKNISDILKQSTLNLQIHLQETYLQCVESSHQTLGMGRGEKFSTIEFT